MRMPLDLLLENAGDYERTHQIMLYVLFKNGRLAEHLGLPATKSVGWEDENRLFDLTLKDGDSGVTGVEVKTWATVSEDQADRQRAWATTARRKLAYVLMGFSEFEGVPGDAARNEHHFGTLAVRDAMMAAAKDSRCEARVRGLAEAYGRWLDRHVAAREKALEKPQDRWGRLEYAVAYEKLRGLISWPGRIYYVANPAGGVNILHFDEDEHDLGVQRLEGTKIFWELLNGWPYFKIGPVPKGEDAREVRATLRELLEVAAKRHGLRVVITGRTGQHMSRAYVDKRVTDLFKGASADEQRARKLLETCRKVYEGTVDAWNKQVRA
jgi:hypothetical protein